MRWFHAIGASGKATANVAKMFGEMGWFVTGSDIQFLPPASNIILENSIPFVEGYHFSHLTKDFWEEALEMGERINIKNKQVGQQALADLRTKVTKDTPDLALIVESATDKNKEYLFAKAKGIDVRPYSQILGEYLVKPESVVVIGSAGKTTTTAFITKLLKDLGKDPSYMIGADVLDFEDSLKNTDSKFSVMEGDEYYNPKLSKGPKFLEYKPKYLVITNIGYEHFDIFPTKEDYVNAFREVVKIVPEDGLIVAKYGDQNIDEVLKDARCRVVRYGLSGELRVESNESAHNSTEKVNKDIVWNVRQKEDGKNIIIKPDGEEYLQFKTDLIGGYNLENILAGVVVVEEVVGEQALAHLQGKSNDQLTEQIISSISSFKGPKKRLETLLKKDNLIIIDDFGVAPDRARNSLTTLSREFSDFDITAVFEPNSGSRPKDEKAFREAYSDVFNEADELIIPDLSEFKTELATSEDFLGRLKDMGINVHDVHGDKLVSYLSKKLKSSNESKNLVVFFSAYRLDAIAKDLVAAFESDLRLKN